jgi:hypothetical protein
MHVHVNGKHHPAAANGNGSSSSTPPAAAAAAAPSKQEQQQHKQQQDAAAAAAGSSAEQQQHWKPEDAKQYMFEQVTGHQHLQPPLEHEQQQQQPPATQAAAAPAAADGQLASAAERLRSAGAIGGVHGVSVPFCHCCFAAYQQQAGSYFRLSASAIR